MSEPALTRLLFWPLLAFLFYQPGVLFLVGFSSASPPVALLRRLSTAATWIGAVGLAVLALVLGWCILRKLRS